MIGSPLKSVTPNVSGILILVSEGIWPRHYSFWIGLYSLNKNERVVLEERIIYIERERETERVDDVKVNLNQRDISKLDGYLQAVITWHYHDTN